MKIIIQAIILGSFMLTFVSCSSLEKKSTTQMKKLTSKKSTEHYFLRKDR